MVGHMCLRAGSSCVASCSLLCPVGSCDEYVNPADTHSRMDPSLHKQNHCCVSGLRRVRDRPCPARGQVVHHCAIAPSAWLRSTLVAHGSRRVAAENRERRRHVPPNEHMPGSYHCAKGSRVVAVWQGPPLPPQNPEKNSPLPLPRRGPPPRPPRSHPPHPPPPAPHRPHHHSL